MDTNPSAGMDFVVLSVAVTQARSWAGAGQRGRDSPRSWWGHRWQAESHKPQRAAAAGRGHLSWL